MELDETSLSANFENLFDGYTATDLPMMQSVLTQLPAAVSGQEFAVQGLRDSHTPAPVTSGNSQTLSLSTSQITALQTSLPLTAVQTSVYPSVREQLQDSRGQGSGQTLDDFLANLSGLQPVGGLMPGSQYTGVIDNTVGVTPCSVSNTFTEPYSYSTSERMDLVEASKVTDLNILAPAPLNIQSLGNPNVAILGQLTDLVQASGLSTDDLPMDQSIQYVDTGSCPPISSSSLTTAVLEQGLQQFQEDIHVYYNADLVAAPDGSDDSNDADIGLDPSGQQATEVETTNIADLISQARARRKIRRNQSRLSESSADVNSPEYKEFLNSLSGPDRKKELNRQAAKRCRDKKFQEEIKLEEKAKSLRRVNSQLKAEKARLQHEADLLKQHRVTRQVSAYL